MVTILALIIFLYHQIQLETLQQPLPINSTNSIFRIVTHVKERQEEFLQNPDSKLLTSKAETIKCIYSFFPPSL